MKNKYKAILFMAIAGLCYATVGAIIKYIGEIPVFEKLFFRTAFGFFFIAAFAVKNKISVKGVNRVGLIGRSITGFTAAALYYLALGNVPLADAVTLTNLYPFVVILGSALFLREKLKSFHAIALSFSILGAVLIQRPGFAAFNPFYLVALLSAVFMGITYVILKHVGETDSPEVLVLYYSGISTLGCIPFMLAGHFVIPNAIQLLSLVSLGLIGTVYQWFVSAAYKYAPAGEVSIYSYSSILFSSVIGISFFSEIPGIATVAGMLSIVGGAYVVFRKEKLSKLK